MNSTQRENVLNVIDDFFIEDEKKMFDMALSTKYKDAQPETVLFLDYSVPELLAMARRLFKRFENRLKSEDWQMLPYSGIPEEPPNTDLAGCLKRAVICLEKADYQTVAKLLRRLMRYQMNHCFAYYDIELNVLSIADAESKYAQMTEKLLSADLLKKDIKDIKASILDSQQKQNDVVKQINDNLKMSNENTAKIKGLLDKAQLQEQSVGQVNSRCSALLDKLQKKDDELVETQKNISIHMSKTEAYMDSAKAVFDNIAKAHNEANKILSEMKKMMGYIADGTLSHSFNKRKENINTKVRFWLICSLVLLILSVVWIIVVFTYLKANTGMVWVDLIINAVKSSIMVFAFGYALNEYAKERTLQEEYAFRESVAVTLTAYLQQLESCSKEEMQKLLMETVEKLYTKPVISNKEYKFSKLDASKIANLVKPVAESINNLTSKK